MAEATVSNVIVKNTCTLANGDDYSETARVPSALWRQVGGGTQSEEGIEKGERGVAAWLRKRNPRFGPDFRVTFIREENTPASQFTTRPQV